ncbi:MAG: curlin repeat-containing protein, partial [Pseudomonadota bacterium]
MDQLSIGGTSTNHTIHQAWDDLAYSGHPRAPEHPNGAHSDDPMKPKRMDPTKAKVRTEKTAEKHGQNAWVDQLGLKNEVDIDQDEAGSGAVADVVQRGDRNDAEVDQTAFGRA